MKIDISKLLKLKINGTYKPPSEVNKDVKQVETKEKKNINENKSK
jgi:hypothetical protein